SRRRSGEVRRAPRTRAREVPGGVLAAPLAAGRRDEARRGGAGLEPNLSAQCDARALDGESREGRAHEARTSGTESAFSLWRLRERFGGPLPASGDRARASEVPLGTDIL